MTALVTLGEIATKGQYGLNAPALKEGDGIRFIRITDIDQNGNIREDGKAFVADDTANLEQYALEENDILIARSGATAGKSLIFRDIGEPAVFAGYLIRFRVNRDRASPQFVANYLHSTHYWNQIFSKRRVAAQPNINAKELAGILLPLPPLSEQRRIVDILNHAASIRRLREEAQKKAQEVIPALFVDMFGDPVANPKGWEVRELSSLVDFVSGATPSKKEERFWGGSVPWISAKDMKFLYLSDSQIRVTEEAFSETNLKLIPENALLIVVRGMILAHTIPIGITTTPLAINQDLKALVTRSSILPTYLCWALLTQHQYLLSEVSTAAHGTRKLEMSVLEAVKIQLPPLDHQNLFCQRVDEVRSIIVQSERSTESSGNLQQSLLAQVFQ